MLEYGAYSPALSTILCKCKRDSVISGTIKYCKVFIIKIVLFGEYNRPTSL